MTTTLLLLERLTRFLGIGGYHRRVDFSILLRTSYRTLLCQIDASRHGQRGFSNGLFPWRTSQLRFEWRPRPMLHFTWPWRSPKPGRMSRPQPSLDISLPTIKSATHLLTRFERFMRLKRLRVTREMNRWNDCVGIFPTPVTRKGTDPPAVDGIINGNDHD